MPNFQTQQEGKLRPDLHKAFLKSAYISNEDCDVGYIVHDGYSWQLVLESQKEAKILEHYGKLWAILSFQESKSGKRIVIARAHRIGEQQ